MTNDELIAELRKHHAAMTPGEWCQGPYYKCDIHSPHQVEGRSYVVSGSSVKPCDTRDAAGIAFLRNALPAIIAALESPWRGIAEAPKDGTIIDVWQKQHWSRSKNRDGTRYQPC